MNNPTISVVMTVYNGERFLCEAMDSILMQTFTDFELIIIDDGSQDATPDILDSYADSRILHIANKSNIGQTPSLNIGIEQAKGEFVARHDADDVSHPQRFARQVSFLKKNSAVGLLGTYYNLIDNEGQTLEVDKPSVENEALQKRLEEGNCFCHGSVMIRHKFLQDSGLYRPQYRVTQDYDLWLRLSECCEIGNLPQTLYDFRFDGRSVSRNKRGLQLSYRRLAWVMAAQRRIGLPEPSFPDDVAHDYPPEPERLLGDARRAAYLFYVSGQMQAARDAATSIREYAQKVDISSEDWQVWLLGQAHALAELRCDSAQGADLVIWFSQEVPALQNPDTLPQLLGRYYADLAFSAYQKGETAVIPSHARRAVYYDKKWLRNRGLWIIAAKSLWQQHRIIVT